MSDQFQFSAENTAKIPAILQKYPDNHAQSAVMPLLDLAQEQNGGWLSKAAIATVATILNIPFIRVQEVASFYSMYHLEPVGKIVVQVCTTTPCWLRGSDDVMRVCENKLKVLPGETKNNITLLEVQCLGACVNAPVVQINGEYVEDLTPETISDILDKELKS